MKRKKFFKDGYEENTQGVNINSMLPIVSQFLLLSSFCSTYFFTRGRKGGFTPALFCTSQTVI